MLGDPLEWLRLTGERRGEDVCSKGTRALRARALFFLKTEDCFYLVLK